MHTELHEACVLHRRSYRESSLLIEFFSERYGRIGAVAKGVTRRGNPVAALLQPFRPLLAAWSTRRGELVTLAQVEAAGEPYVVSGQAALCAFYLNELVLRALPRNDAHPELFARYRSALQRLAADPSAAEPTLRIFEKHLLETAGYGVILDSDVETARPVDPERLYRYIPGHGPTLVQEGSTTPEEGIAVSGGTLVALDEEELGAPLHRTEAKRLLRALLRLHLGDKPLHSRAWFDEY
jgi:DNA repair protein RecO (recombination protein O)